MNNRKQNIKSEDAGDMGVQTPKEGQSLGDLYPELIKEWDFENNDLNPFDIKRASMYNAYWICSRGHR